MESKTSVKNRSEILFIYDVKWANPNGDPIDENKPRIDEETGINFVTDVRLKRTIRDYFNDYLKQKVFIKESRDDDNNLKTKEKLVEEYKIKDKKDLLDYLDIRLFGSTTAIKGKTIVYTGPVQFNFGRSLHKVDLKYVKGTTVMPSKDKKSQGTMTEAYILPYSLIAFYGIVNEVAGKDVNLLDKDVDLMIESVWSGTKNLITRSKFGQTPRLLLQIIYKEDAKGFYIGDLISKVKVKSEKKDKELRDLSDFELDISTLENAIADNHEKIEVVKIKTDKDLRLIKSGKVDKLKTDFKF